MNTKKTMWTLRPLLLTGMIGLLFAAFSCKDNEADPTYGVTAVLNYPAPYAAQAGVTVKLTNASSGVAFEAATDAAGRATFEVPGGMYNVEASEQRMVNAEQLLFNGTVSGVTVAAAGEIPVTITASASSQIVIKEVYSGGCLQNDGVKVFQRDPYVILYNNSAAPATLANACLGIVRQFNSNVASADYVGAGATEPFYAAEHWIPAGDGFWYFQQDVTLAPGQQIVIALQNAVDNTQVHANSINFDKAGYYCTYHPESGYNLPLYYPAPAPNIPGGNYLKAVRYGQSTAWTFSTTSPAFFLFTTKGTAPAAFGEDASADNYYNNEEKASNARKKVPEGWVLDAMEAFVQGAAINNKRLTAAVDAGAVMYESKKGYALYRNVDKAATEALPENAGKIVYGYNKGTTDVPGGTTDPSGIDAEASIAAGARIVYRDTNNSSNDFHQRNTASLKN